MRAVVIAIALIVAGGIADADPRAEKLFKVGQDQYNIGDFAGAAKSFLAAYQIEPDPAFLFNIAQAYRQAKACAKAANYFRQFMAAYKQPPNPDKIEHFITEMDECATKQAAAIQTARPEPTPVEPVESKPAPLEPAAAPLVGSDVPSAEEDTPGRVRRQLGVGVAVLGGAALVTGVVFGLAARAAERRYETACPTPCTQWDTKYDPIRAEANVSGHRDSAIAVFGISAGVAAIAGGVVLYLTGRTTESPSVIPLHGGAVATFGLRF